MRSENKWYAVYTKPKWEKKTAELLSKKQIKVYCPLNKVVRQWSDRKKTIEEPLFKSYIFINATEKEHLSIRQTYGVINFVYWLGKPAVIKDAEIDAIQNFLEEYQDVRLEYTGINVHDTVKIREGIFKEQEAFVLEVKNKFVRVYLPTLKCTMVAATDDFGASDLVEDLNNMDKKIV